MHEHKLVVKKSIDWVCERCGAIASTEANSRPSYLKATESGHIHQWVPVQVRTELRKDHIR